MTEVTKKVATKKTTTRKSTKKETTNPMEEMFKNMTPEMMQQFMAFMQQQTQPVEVVETTKVEKQKINKSYLSRIRDREVVVRSVSSGVVGWKSEKTKIFYSWVNYGDTEILTIGDILEMENRSKKFLHTPWLVVEDDEVNEALGLIEKKEEVEVFEDFETFLELPISEIKNSLSKVEKGYLGNIHSKVQQAIDDDILTDFRKIRELEKVMKTEFKY